MLQKRQKKEKPGLKKISEHQKSWLIFNQSERNVLNYSMDSLKDRLALFQNQRKVLLTKNNLNKP